MADSQGGSHSGRQRNSGRKRKHEGRNAQKNWNSEHKRIFLSLTIFKSWKHARNIAGYGLCSNSDFAATFIGIQKVRLYK